jgi:D-alanyl-D-alanine carboxypeptidase
MRSWFNPLVFLALFAVIVCVGLAASLGRAVHQPISTDVSSNSNTEQDGSSGHSMTAGEPFITVPSATSFSSGKTAGGSTSQQIPQVPSDGITASAYLIGNIKTGQVYASRLPTKALPVASISKLVTAIVATDTISPTTTIEIASTTFMADLPPDTSGVHGGESFQLNEILKPLLLSSSNRAAEAIASTTDRDHFLDLMSSISWEIGMPHAFFGDASGLDPDNVATAEDLFGLARYLYQYRPDILAITRIPVATTATTTEHDAHTFESTHPFVNDPRFIGGKTGRTPEAGETMLTMLNIDNTPIAFIVMHSDYGKREADTSLLIKKFMAL